MSEIILSNSSVIGVVGAGAMGCGIAQVAATAGHTVKLFDTRPEALVIAIRNLKTTFDKLVEKQKITSAIATEILNRISLAPQLEDLKHCDLIIEAIVEQLAVKQELFRNLEKFVSRNAILATNTSSLSVTALAASCSSPDRVIGLHFFNPAPLMPLVEVIPALQTNESIPEKCKELMRAWGKIPVTAKDTPGFIVNRVARPFYGEALRICEEGIADYATIDRAMKEYGGFRMGPFELMDLIGNDINYTVTETVWTQCFFDPRYKPSIIQKKMMESGRYGKKSGRGYYDYSASAIQPTALKDEKSGRSIQLRVTVMLINEAAEALYYNIASKEDIELAMTKGVNYPKGLLQWADELGISNVLNILDELYTTYREDRYRASVLLRKMAENNQQFNS
jgi:3-hydroxybutyryl-CoA dehydrogenase